MKIAERSSLKILPSPNTNVCEGLIDKTVDFDSSYAQLRQHLSIMKVIQRIWLVFS